jgi:hypothetical protein
MRNDLVAAIKSDLAESSSCVLRKTFIFFCKSAVDTFSRAFFKQNFLQAYLVLHKDKVSGVRMEFARSVRKIKPSLDYDTGLANELITILTSMHSDLDPDVVEAVQQSDDELLQMKKRTRDQEKAANAEDAAKVAYEAGFSAREAKVMSSSPEIYPIGRGREEEEKHRGRGDEVRFLGHIGRQQEV